MKNNGVIVHNLSYLAQMGAKDNGKSLELENNLLRESYVLGGTPGKENSQQTNTLNVTNSINTTNTSNTSVNLIDTDLINTSLIIITTNNSNQSTSQNNSLTNLEEDDDKKTSPQYNFQNFSAQVTTGNELNFEILIKNGNTPHQFSVWSYIYRGKKCYSCGDSTREGNMQTITLLENEEDVIFFTLNLPEDIKEGEYNLKVKIIKDDQSTAKELKEKIVVKKDTNKQNDKLIENTSSTTTTFMEETIGEEINLNSTFTNFSKTELLETSTSNEKTNNVELEKKQNLRNKLTGTVVYQSKSRKIKGLIPYFLTITFILLVAVFLLNRKK